MGWYLHPPQGLDSLVELLLSRARPKSLRGSLLTGPALAGLAEAYVKVTVCVCVCMWVCVRVCVRVCSFVCVYKGAEGKRGEEGLGVGVGWVEVCTSLRQGRHTAGASADTRVAELAPGGSWL